MDRVGHSWIELDRVGHSWIQLDRVGQSWTQLDAVGYSWTQLDAVGLHGPPPSSSWRVRRLSNSIQLCPTLSNCIQLCPTPDVQLYPTVQLDQVESELCAREWSAVCGGLLGCGRYCVRRKSVGDNTPQPLLSLRHFVYTTASVTSATPRADLRFTGVVAIRPLVVQKRAMISALLAFA